MNNHNVIGYYTLNGVSYAFMFINGRRKGLGPNGGSGFMPSRENNAGDIVGSQGTHGVLLHGPLATQVDGPGAATTYLLDVNKNSQFVGYYLDNSGVAHGLYGSVGALVTIDPPGSTDTYLSRINDAGQMIGNYFDTSGFLHGFLYFSGHYSIFDPFGSTYTYPNAITNSGQIAGSFTIIDLGPPVTGFSQGFILSKGSNYVVIEDPNAVSPVSQNSTFVTDMNNQQTIAGGYYGFDAQYHAFVAVCSQRAPCTQ